MQKMGLAPENDIKKIARHLQEVKGVLNLHQISPELIYNILYEERIKIQDQELGEWILRPSIIQNNEEVIFSHKGTSNWLHTLLFLYLCNLMV